MIDFSQKPLFLAPMAGYSDLPFRAVVKKFGADFTISEMISANALVFESKKSLKMLEKHESESPFIVQIAGSDESVIKKAVSLLNELDEGKSVNLRKFKLDEDNALCVQNENNRIKNDLNYAFSRIKGKKEFEDESDLLAFETLLQNGDMAQIQSVKLTKDASQRLGLIERFEKGTLQMSGAEFESLLNAGGFDEKDFLNAAKMSVKKLNPDALIAVFKRLKNTYPEALRAYLYILAEFSLFDELRLEIGNDKTHFNDFKIVLLAREKNQKVDLNKLIC